MAGHVKAVGIIHIVLGAMGVCAALIVLLVFGGLAGATAVGGAGDADARTGAALMGGIGGFVFILILALSAPAVVAGIGLLKFRPWARILTIVLSCLNLLNIPIGTALGVYSLWVLLNSQTEPLFRQPAAGMPAPY